MLYVGETRYRDVEFSFAFDGLRLELVPLPGEDERARELNPELVSAGARFFTGEGIPIGAECLPLFPRNAEGLVVAFPRSERFDPCLFSPLSLGVDVRGYFTIAEGARVSGLRFKSGRLARCFDARAAVSRGVSDDARSFTVCAVKTEPTTCSFNFRGKSVRATLFHSATMSYKPDEPPLSVESCLDFDFPDDADCPFIAGLVHVARRFLRFCLQASDVEFDSIDLMGRFASTDFSGLTSRCGRVILCDRPRDPGFTPKFHIPLGRANGLEEALLRSLASEGGGLTLRHLPGTDKIRRWDEARSILLSASFDYEVGKLYPSGIPHSSKELEARSVVVGALSQVLEEGRGGSRAKRMAKWLSGIVEESDSLSVKMRALRKDHASLIGSLGFASGSEEGFGDFADRFAKTRNALAHGFIDVERDERIIDDSLLLEKVVLSIQLLNLGLSDEEARSVISLALER